METNHVDATVDFVDVNALKQDSMAREGQSDAKPGIENETFVHKIRASALSAADSKQILPQKSQVDATVDFVDVNALKQDSMAREGQSDAKPGIENETFVHKIRASALSTADSKQILPEVSRSPKGV